MQPQPIHKGPKILPAHRKGVNSTPDQMLQLEKRNASPDDVAQAQVRLGEILNLPLKTMLGEMTGETWAYRIDKVYLDDLKRMMFVLTKCEEKK